MCGGFKPGRNGKCTSNCFHEEIRQDVFRLRTLTLIVALHRSQAKAPMISGRAWLRLLDGFFLTLWRNR